MWELELFTFDCSCSYALCWKGINAGEAGQVVNDWTDGRSLILSQKGTLFGCVCTLVPYMCPIILVDRLCNQML